MPPRNSKRPAKATEHPQLPSWNLGKPLVDISNREEPYRVLYEERDRVLYWGDADSKQGK